MMDDKKGIDTRLEYWAWFIGIWIVTVLIEVAVNRSLHTAAHIGCMVLLYHRMIGSGRSGWMTLWGLLPLGYIILGFFPNKENADVLLPTS